MMCKYEHDGDCCNCGSPQYMCKCKPKLCGSLVPMTNADRIRAMTDEELAREINLMFKCDSDWQREFLNWLQQPEDEDTDGH